MWFVEDKKNVFLISYFFLLELSLCYKKLDHGGDTVDMPLSKIHPKYPLPININKINTVINFLAIYHY